MPKWKQTYEAGRKYQKTWERDYPWIKQASDGTENAFCKLCSNMLQPKAAILQKHSKSADHVARVKSSSRTRPLAIQRIVDIDDDVKRCELELAAAICCHCPIMSIDHLVELFLAMEQVANLVKSACIEQSARGLFLML